MGTCEMMCSSVHVTSTKYTVAIFIAFILLLLILLYFFYLILFLNFITDKNSKDLTHCNILTDRSKARPG